MNPSPQFMFNVRTLYLLGLEQSLSNKVVRFGINSYTHHAPPAYISAVASVESFVNQTLLGVVAKDSFDDLPLWLLEPDWVEKLELKQKLVIIPQLLFGQTFKKGTQPLQDMNTLLKIRNDLVHYKEKLKKNIDDIPSQC